MNRQDNDHYLFGLDFKQPYDLEYGKRKLTYFYIMVCQKMYGRKFSRNKEKFQLEMYPEYASKRDCSHLHFHGVLTIKPDELNLFKKHYKNVWAKLTDGECRTYLREDKNKTAAEKVSIQWQSYMKKDFPKHQLRYTFQ